MGGTHELRRDPVAQRWVVVAAHRQERPLLPKTGCPFCPGSEEVPDGNWDVKALPNRFPALSLDAAEAPGAKDDLFARGRASGACEVVLYSPDHRAAFESLPLSHARRVVELWQERTRSLAREQSVRYVIPFENKGREIGVTLDHPHGQLYALGFVPRLIATELESASRHRERTGRCLFCDVAARESQSGERVVSSGERFVAFVPFAPQYPFEVHVYPRRHLQLLTELRPAEAEGLAAILQDVRRRYNAHFGFDLPLMMYVHQAPVDGRHHASYHLHVELRPIHRARDKLKYMAGIEHGTGVFVNDAAPEESARLLREARA